MQMQDRDLCLVASSPPNRTGEPLSRHVRPRRLAARASILRLCNLHQNNDELANIALGPWPRMRLYVTALAGIFLAPAIRAFYLPGAAPHNYAEGDQVDLFVNALTPMLAGTDDSKLVSMLTLFCDSMVHKVCHAEITHQL